IRLATLPHCAFGLWLTALAFYLPVVWLLGEDVPGHVAEKYTQTNRKGHVSYYVTYAYDVGGVEYRDRTGVSRAAYDALTVGEAFTVRALPALPDIWELPQLPDAPGRSQIVIVAVAAVVFNAALAAGLWFAWFRPRRRLLLLRDGLAARGTVGRKYPHAHKVYYAYEAAAVGKGECLPPTRVTCDEGVTVSPPL